jgi:hypothetical protein
MDPFLIPVMIKGHDAMARRDDPQKSPPWQVFHDTNLEEITTQKYPNFLPVWLVVVHP